MLSDLSGCLGVDFPARQRGESITDINHGVTAFALSVVDPEAEAFRAGVRSEFGDKSISLIHSPRRSAEPISDNFVRTSMRRAKKPDFAARYSS
jgi:hypothetical protein